MTSLADHLAEHAPHGVHYETRCKFTMSALAITAPLVFIGTICAIVTVLYSINEEVMIFTDSQEAETSYCTRVQYVHLLNGVCTRGVAVGIDVETSCIQWDDSDRWKELDETNAIRVDRGLTNYTKSDFETEATEMWPILGYFSIIAVIFAGFNLIVSLAALDTDYLYTRMGIADVDYFVLTSSCLCTSTILAFIGYTINKVYYADVTNGDMWYTEECTTASSPTLGAYVLCMGGLFTWISWGSSFYSYIYLYIYEDTIMEWYHTRKERREVQHAQDASDAQDEMERAQREANHRRDRHKAANNYSDDNINSNGGKSQAVARKGGGNMYESLGAGHDSDSSSLSTHSSSEDEDGNENGSVKLRVPSTPRDSPIKGPIKPKKPPKPSSTAKNSAKGTPGNVGASVPEPKGQKKGKGKEGDKKEGKESEEGGAVKTSKKDGGAKETVKKPSKSKKKASESTAETTPIVDKKPPSKPPKPSATKDSKNEGDPLKAIIDAHAFEMTETKGRKADTGDNDTASDEEKPSFTPAAASKKKKKKKALPKDDTDTVDAKGDARDSNDTNDDKDDKDDKNDNKEEGENVVRAAEKTEEASPSPGKKSAKKAVIRVTVADSDSDSSSSGSSED